MAEARREPGGNQHGACPGQYVPVVTLSNAIALRNTGLAELNIVPVHLGRFAELPSIVTVQQSNLPISNEVPESRGGSLG